MANETSTRQNETIQKYCPSHYALWKNITRYRFGSGEPFIHSFPYIAGFFGLSLKGSYSRRRGVGNRDDTRYSFRVAIALPIPLLNSTFVNRLRRKGHQSGDSDSRAATLTHCAVKQSHSAEIQRRQPRMAEEMEEEAPKPPALNRDLPIFHHVRSLFPLGFATFTLLQIYLPRYFIQMRSEGGSYADPQLSGSLTTSIQ
jgi:hypothetical protein